MGTGATHVGRRTLVRTGVAGAWATPLVLVSVPAHAAVCSPGGRPALELKAFNLALPGFREADGSVTYQPTVTLTNNGPGPVTVLQATAAPFDVEMLISSLDIDVGKPTTWGPVTALPNGTTSLTLQAPAPQDVIAAGAEKEYTFLLSLLGAAPDVEHSIVLTLGGQCESSGVQTLTFQVNEPDEPE
jgi:hypothetical protein